MRHDQGYLNSFTTGRINPDDIEHGIREGRRLRAQAFRGAFGKVRSHFAAQH